MGLDTCRRGRACVRGRGRGRRGRGGGFRRTDRVAHVAVAACAGHADESGGAIPRGSASGDDAATRRKVRARHFAFRRSHAERVLTAAVGPARAEGVADPTTRAEGRHRGRRGRRRGRRRRGRRGSTYPKHRLCFPRRRCRLHAIAAAAAYVGRAPLAVRLAAVRPRVRAQDERGNDRQDSNDERATDAGAERESQNLKATDDLHLRTPPWFAEPPNPDV